MTREEKLLYSDVVQVTDITHKCSGLLGWVVNVEATNGLRTGYYAIRLMDHNGDMLMDRLHHTQLRALS